MRHAGAAVLVTALLTGAAHAAVFTVTNTLDSGPGSLRDALNAADATVCPAPGSCQIEFHIAGSPGSDGAFTIVLVNGLPKATNTIIDGATQTAFSGNTNPLGPEIVVTTALCPSGLCYGFLIGEGSELRNVVVNGFSGNVGRGILVSTQNVPATIAGNYIGTDATGRFAVPNDYGVELSGRLITIGGTAPKDANVISGNGIGITLIRGLTWSNDNHSILGNRIGTAANGFDPLPNGIGVRILQGSSTRPWYVAVGGLGAGEGNVIAFNNTWGVQLGTMGCFDTVRGNSIHSNGGEGIHRDDSACAFCMPESGCPVAAKAPRLLSASYSPGTNTTTVTGDYYSVANTALTLDWYTNSEADPSGFGEGEFFLGTTNVTTDATGAWTSQLPGDQRFVNLTATTTESPFSNALGSEIDLAVAVTEGHAEPVAPTERLRWTIAVANHSSNPATNVRVDVDLPGSLSDVQRTAGAQWSCTGTYDFSCVFLQPLQGGGAGSITVEATPAAPNTTYTARATISSSQLETVPADNTSQESTFVRAFQSDLSAWLDVPPASVEQGARVAFGISVVNGGPDTEPAAEATITFSPPVTVEEILTQRGPASCSGTGPVVCSFPAIVANDSRDLSFVVRTPSQPGALSCTTVVKGTNSDNDPSDDSSTVSTTVARRGRRRTVRH